MYWRLTLAFVISVFLAGTHWKAYVSGKKAVLAEVQAKALEAERAARQRERELVLARQQVEEAYAKHKRQAASAAAAARSELDRLRITLANPRVTATPGTAAQPRADGPGSAERELLAACAGEVQGLAAEADRLAGKVTGLQSYVREVCLPR